MKLKVDFHKLQSLLDWSYANDLLLDFSYGHVSVLSRDVNDNSRFISHLDYSSIDEAFEDIFAKD